jgi:short-subunit dehydrogenase
MTPTESPVALVTGASAGIGLAIAGALAGAGFGLALVARDAGRLAAAARAIDAAAPGASVETHALDASDARALRRLVEDVADRHGRLDLLVNNAGRADLLPIPESDDETAAAAMATNALGPLAAIAAAWPIFERQGGGRVLNVSSWAARDPFPGFLIYAATKAALNSLTRSVHNEGRGMGVVAHAIGPGAVETAMLRSAFDEGAVPPSVCLAPDHVAALALACARGDHDDHAGRCLYIRMDDAGRPEVTVGD